MSCRLAEEVPAPGVMELLIPRSLSKKLIWLFGLGDIGLLVGIGENWFPKVL